MIHHITDVVDVFNFKYLVSFSIFCKIKQVLSRDSWSWLHLLTDAFLKLCRDLTTDLPSSHSSSEHVRILRELCDITVTTGQDAVFEVELSHSGVTNGEWWLGDNPLQNNDLNQMSSQGRVHRLVLKMVTTDESGDVAFVVGEEKSVACLLVEEKPKGKGDDMVTRVLLLTAISIDHQTALSWQMEICWHHHSQHPNF